MDFPSEVEVSAESIPEERPTIAISLNRKPKQEAKGAAFHEKKEKFYSKLGSLWHDEAKKECTGILEGEFYNFASTGDFK